MTATKTHAYRGYDILPTSSADTDKRWYIPKQHSSGIWYDESLCHQCYTLAQAREHIDEMIRDAELCAA